MMVLSLFGCAELTANKASDESAESDDRASKKKKKRKKSGDEASASSRASTSAAPAPSAVAPTAPTPTAAPAPPAPTLATMFDGDSAVPGGKSVTFGRATLQLPPDWKTAGGWDSVDVVQRNDKSALIVLLRLDISEAYLDTNIATWVKVPFSTEQVSWEPRVAGKLGAEHLDAKIAKGTGQFGSESAEFWHVATGFDGKRYGLVAIAGLKGKADPKAREELVATVRSIRFR